METFFKENTDIQEWVDLLIEKIFTVCLLSGPDADSEFNRGRQASDRIAYILQGLTKLPNDTLKEGIRQLVEQRLPDPRVIDNFPQFYTLMEDMIQSGVPNAQTTEVASYLPTSAFFTEMPSSKILLTRTPDKTENSSQVYLPEVAVSDNEDSVAINVFAPLAPLVPYPSILHNESISPVSSEPELVSSESATASLEPGCSLKDESECVNANPPESEPLSRVLKELYPEEQPRWNIMIDQIPILTQIENLVILISKESCSEIEDTKKSLEKQGWSVVICQHEDLAYPRRLERFIRQTLRKSVYSNTSLSFLS